MNEEETAEASEDVPSKQKVSILTNSKNERLLASFLLFLVIPTFLACLLFIFFFDVPRTSNNALFMIFYRMIKASPLVFLATGVLGLLFSGNGESRRDMIIARIVVYIALLFLFVLLGLLSFNIA